MRRSSSIVVLPPTFISPPLSSSSSMASTISSRSICVRQNAPILAEAAACGDRPALRQCFLAVPDIVTLDDLQSCFVEGHCTVAEAASEATSVLQNCDAGGSTPELRRRGPNDANPSEPSVQNPTSCPFDSTRGDKTN
ncbi:hypothetical protein F5Y03DRAFT_226584 [Xylaria venustula]|nr:hypothetical protein F5Y03DRAFT_226584 [Xylaria venustula]